MVVFRADLRRRYRQWRLAQISGLQDAGGREAQRAGSHGRSPAEARRGSRGQYPRLLPVCLAALLSAAGRGYPRRRQNFFHTLSTKWLTLTLYAEAPILLGPSLLMACLVATRQPKYRTASRADGAVCAEIFLTVP